MSAKGWYRQVSATYNTSGSYSVFFEEIPLWRTRGHVSIRAESYITEGEIPYRERTSQAGCRATRIVRLSRWSTMSLWVADGYIEWLVTWIAAEQGTGGVPFTDFPLL